MVLGSGIRKKPIPDPGSRSQKGTGSRIRICNTGIRINPGPEHGSKQIATESGSNPNPKKHWNIYSKQFRSLLLDISVFILKSTELYACRWSCARTSGGGGRTRWRPRTVAEGKWRLSRSSRARYSPRSVIVSREWYISHSQVKLVTVLKVDSNEKLGGREEDSNWDYSLALWRSRIIWNLNLFFALASGNGNRFLH